MKKMADICPGDFAHRLVGKAFEYAFGVLVDGAMVFLMVSRLKVAVEVFTSCSDFRPVSLNKLNLSKFRSQVRVGNLH